MEEIDKEINSRDDIKASSTLLKLLLKDKTTGKNILWCTNDYISYGGEYSEEKEILSSLITGEYSSIIQPRAFKPKEVQERRIKKNAEVFTPSWVCNEQNNQIDEAWFGQKNVFNIPKENGWITNANKIPFSESKSWQSYVSARRLEITCGEAPYLVSRYDTTTGLIIPLNDRIGLFDRKMRVVSENCIDDEEWNKWSIKALKSIYGYDYQGDNLLLARENLLLSYIDYYKDHFKSNPTIETLKPIVTIITWNIWQMDGLRCTVPYSCHDEIVEDTQLSLFDFDEPKERVVQCPGCEKNDMFSHNGIYCKVYDWFNLNKSIRFVDILKEGNDGKI